MVISLKLCWEIIARVRILNEFFKRCNGNCAVFVIFNSRSAKFGLRRARKSGFIKIARRVKFPHFN